VVAGPGTGKTTALVARILKLLFVDAVPASGIVATTFTKKAASELRSRLIEVGFPLASELASMAGTEEKRKAILAVDVNQVWTGTTDSLCQELLTRHRLPGEEVPIAADEYVTEILMLTQGLFADGRHRSRSLADLLVLATGQSRLNVPNMRRLLSSIADRRRHDELDMPKYLRTGSSSEKRGRERLGQALQGYDSALQDRSLVDYAGVEHETLRRLQAGKLTDFTGSLQAVLVDEYQDTNLLQEDLYLTMAIESGASITVVGDDDQSLYRFRGATVELFTDFPARASQRLRTTPTTHYLKTNHRSSQEIVQFVNAFAENDVKYQSARSAGKPALLWRHGSKTGLPILGMFRDDVPTLANSLGDFLEDVFIKRGRLLPNGERIRKGKGGGLGDAALLSYSPRESNPAHLIPHLRNDLQARGLSLFNPRGYQVGEVRDVQLLAGLSLEALDPSGALASSVWQSAEVTQRFDAWRVASRAAMTTDPSLRRFVQKWRDRESRANWPTRTPFLELLYGLAQRLPGCLDDPERALYVEIFARQVNASEQVGSFRGQVLLNRAGASARGNPLGDGSVKELIRTVLIPIADNDVGLNEDLIDAFPAGRLPVLSIHQSKGLEFPLVIVDVGSRFRTNHRTQARLRFPRVGDEAHTMEDYFRRYSPMGPPSRSPVDRAFDDLIRQYFVAFSRARNVLLLVGLRTALPGGSIPNVALGWNRDGVDRWAGDLPFMEV
jgi:DNA helicase-2/ATP-dependent DNA helicase PcrA